MNCPCRLCGSRENDLVAVYDRRPEWETDFGIPPERYYRELRRCRVCDVFFAVHDFVPDDFYRGRYTAATYSDRMVARYEQVRNLPPDRSDNKQRVARIHRFLMDRGLSGRGCRVLDVGSGLCVFLAEMKDLGYACYAIDPDPAAIRHAIENVGITAGHAGSLEDYPVGLTFHLLTWNKVLEHVPDPVRLLALSRERLTPDGSVYVELPDGETAARIGGFGQRAEFILEHLTVHTLKSFRYLAGRAGFDILELRRITDPSGKFTLFGFLAPAGRA